MTLRVLIVEDSSTDAKLLVHELQHLNPAVEVLVVDDADAMRAALARTPWDVVLSDWSMPRFSGLAALRLVQEVQPEVPFIIVSGAVGEEVAVEAMRAGACDYVLKDRLSRLAPVIERELVEREQRAAYRSAQRALVESESRFSCLWESGIIGIFIVDPQGCILEANDAYLEMVGYDRADVIAGHAKWSEGGPGLAREVEAFRRDGTRVPLLVGASMLDASRRLVFAINLTERKRVDAALRDTENQLRHAQKMEAVGRLAGGIAHDFNNLLAVIVNYTEVLQQELKVGDPIRDDIIEIERAAERAAALTGQLLLFSRQQVLQPKILALNDLVTGMESMLRRLLGAGVELTLQLGSSEQTRIEADPGSVEQVIMNLAVNARDAMATGGELRIDTASVVLDEHYCAAHVGVKPGTYVRLTVRDNGAGMDAATLTRIFEPFFTTKAPGRGTGLGLSTVFGIVHQAGGSLAVESQVGSGTTFAVFLPHVAGEVTVAPPQPAPAHLRGTETILLVEDEDALRKVTASVLRRYGYRVIEAANAGEALMLCEQDAGRIDLLLTDVVMPRMSGPALAARLARFRAPMKVLFMSGYTEDSVANRDITSGEAPFLQKPFRPSALARRIRELFDR